MIPILALCSWPFICIIFFKRYSAGIAVFASVLAGYLLLPEKTELDLPLLPALDKKTIPALAATLWASVLVVRSTPSEAILPKFLPSSIYVRFLLLLLVGGSFMTAVTNGDRLFYGPTTLPALSPYDAFSYILSALMFALPMLLARKYLGSPESHKMILRLLCIFGLAYSLLVLIETRVSPLMHYWVYGFFPHSWIQHVRGGGSWRPVVFLGHGLLVGIFLSGTVLAAIGTFKTCHKDKKLHYLGAALWLLIVLSLSRNLGALAITIILAPVAFFLAARLQLFVASIITITFLLYPLAREAEIIPIDAILEAVADYDPARAHSLETRLKNEDKFLEKSNERILFGWGGWGRSRTYDPDTGVDTTIADGSWVITLSVSGWVGYVARFGLVCAPIFLIFLNRKRYNIGVETSVLTLIVAGNLVDLIPNSSLTPITALVAGALWGRVELGRISQADTNDITEINEQPRGHRTGQPFGASRPEPVNSYTRQTVRVKHSREIKKKV